MHTQGRRNDPTYFLFRFSFSACLTMRRAAFFFSFPLLAVFSLCWAVSPLQPCVTAGAAECEGGCAYPCAQTNATSMYVRRRVCVCVCKARRGEARRCPTGSIRSGAATRRPSFPHPPALPASFVFLSFCSVLTLLTFPPRVMGLGPDARRHVNKAFSTSSIFAANTSEQACPFCV